MCSSIEQAANQHNMLQDVTMDLDKSSTLDYVITESYAGICTGSYAFKRCLAFVKARGDKHYAAIGSCRLYCTWEKDSIPNDLVAAADPPHKPLHAFNDILDRLFDEDRTHLHGGHGEGDPGPRTSQMK